MPSSRKEAEAMRNKQIDKLDEHLKDIINDEILETAVDHKVSNISETKEQRKKANMQLIVAQAL